jgi:hypothetical protein
VEQTQAFANAVFGPRALALRYGEWLADPELARQPRRYGFYIQEHIALGENGIRRERPKRS